MRERGDKTVNREARRCIQQKAINTERENGREGTRQGKKEKIKLTQLKTNEKWRGKRGGGRDGFTEDTNKVRFKKH